MGCQWQRRDSIEANNGTKSRCTLKTETRCIQIVKVVFQVVFVNLQGLMVVQC